MLGTRKDYMSKIGDIRLQLDEAAERLGFESLEMAQNAGCEVEWEGTKAVLVEPLELAHRAWEKEKEEVLEDLGHLLNIYKEVKPDEDIIKKAIKFVEEAHE